MKGMEFQVEEIRGTMSSHGGLLAKGVTKSALGKQSLTEI